jgi:2-amino-4-hydroxy-6-hydroxymethyldihydropteridine diphosphokinase
VSGGYLGLGSNVGDPAAHLRAALELLEGEGVEIDAVSSTYVTDPVGHLRAAIELLTEHGVEVTACSSVYETEPVGEILDQPDFLNAAIRVETALQPEELLDVCKAIEVEQGRMLAGPRHGPRPLDVDLLLIDGVEMESERLTLPHPEVTSRRFVLVPLLELDASLALPDGTRLSEALTGLGEGERVVKVGPLLSRD